MVRVTRATTLTSFWARHLGALFFVAMIGSLPLKATPALAQQNVCSERAEVLNHLSSAYKEAPVAMGLANNGGVIEVLRAADRASFTIIITMPDGISCMIAAGESWEDLPQMLVSGSKI